MAWVVVGLCQSGAGCTALSNDVIAQFWLSNRLAVLESPALQVVNGDTCTLALWGRPAAGENLQGFSLNLVGEPFAGVALQQVAILNPALPAPNTLRFQTVFDSSAGLAMFPEGTYGFNAFTVLNNVPGIPNGAGIGPGCDGDPGCFDGGSEGAWLLGFITYEAQQAGMVSDWYLGISKLGVLHAGKSVEETLVSFGSLSEESPGQPDVAQAYAPPNGSTGPAGFRDARITVLDVGAASQTQWSGAPGATESWHNAAQWSDGLPSALSTALIDPLAASTIVLSGEAVARHVLLSSGTLQVGSGAAVDSSVEVRSAGRLSGSGWIMGDLAVNALDAGGALVLTNEDPLHVLGEASIEGAALGVDEAFRPPRGVSQLTLLRAFGGVVGRLDAQPGELATGLELMQIWHNPTEIVLQLYYESADFDDDGDVDGRDFLLLQGGWGGVGTGDANGDGMVDSADLGVWQSQVGSDAGVGVLSIAVPEPTSFWLLAGSALSLVVGRRRRAF